jgi:hypothetical protein
MRKALAIALMVAFSAVFVGASENTTTAGNTNTQKHPTTKVHKNLKKGSHKGGKKGKKNSGGTTTPAPK